MIRILASIAAFLAAASPTFATADNIWLNRPAGLVAAWDFSGHRTTSPTGHAGTLYNGATVPGRWISLDGTNDYFEIPDANEFSFTNGSGTDAPFTLCLWLNRSSQTGQRVLLAKAYYSGGNVLEYQFGFGATGTGRPFLALYGNSSGSVYIGRSCTSSLSTGAWQFLACSYSGSEASSGVKIYIDGVQSDTADVSAGSYTGMPNTAAPVKIGSIFPGFDSTSGSISGIGVFNRALSNQEILQIYNAGAARISNGGTP